MFDVFCRIRSRYIYIMTEFQPIFQNESPNFFLIKTKITEIYHVLASNFMKKKYIKKIDYLKLKFDSENLLPLKDIYLGSAATDIILNYKINDDDLTSIKKSAQSFYMKALFQVQKQFQIS